FDSRLAELDQTSHAKDGRLQDLTQETSMLRSQVSLKDRKLQDLEAKMLKSDQDLDVKLANTSKGLDQSRKQVKELVDENRSIRQQISDLSATSTGYEEMLRRKD
ncbi:heavy chain, partial [Aspergillus sclerotialis]